MKIPSRRFITIHLMLRFSGVFVAERVLRWEKKIPWNDHCASDKDEEETVSRNSVGGFARWFQDRNETLSRNEHHQDRSWSTNEKSPSGDFRLSICISKAFFFYAKPVFSLRLFLHPSREQWWTEKIFIDINNHDGFKMKLFHIFNNCSICVSQQIIVGCQMCGIFTHYWSPIDDCQWSHFVDC